MGKGGDDFSYTLDQGVLQLTSEQKKLPRHFVKTGNFSPTYVVGVLGEAYFYLGDA